MGGSMKGHNSSSNGRREGRPYGLILIMAFGAAVLGVMLLHKLREKRIFNLLLKDKDRQLISLHLLLQKEREYNKEARRKNEEMKAKLYSIRMQKRELEGSIMEMRSTISSMRDERRTLESALEEKQNEIKMLRERAAETAEFKENSQVMALTEILKQKEAEIEDLKHRLEYPMKVWSVSTDDPSKPSVNLTTKEKVEVSNVKQEDGRLESTTRVNGSGNESTNYQDGEKSRGGEDGRKNGVGFSDRREMTGVESEKMESSQDKEIREGNNQGEKSIDEVEAKKINDSNGREGLGIGEAKSNANATEIVGNHGDEVLKTRNEDSGEEILDGKEHEGGEIGQQEKNDSQGGEYLENGANSRGGMKLETREKSQRSSWFRTRGKRGYLSRTKGQRSRLLAKSKKFERIGNIGNFEHNRDLDMRSGRVFKDGMENGRYEKPRNGEIEKLNGHGDHIVGENRLVDHHQQGESLETKTNYRVGLTGKEEGNDTSNTTGVEPLKPQNFKDVENISVKVAHNQSDQNVENDHSKQSIDRTIFREANETAGDAKQQKPDEVSQTEEKERSGEKVDDDSEKYEEAEDSNVADVEEAKRDVLRESTSELEEDKEEYKEEEADEPHF